MTSARRSTACAVSNNFCRGAGPLGPSNPTSEARRERGREATPSFLLANFCKQKATGLHSTGATGGFSFCARSGLYGLKLLARSGSRTGSRGKSGRSHIVAHPSPMMSGGSGVWEVLLVAEDRPFGSGFAARGADSRTMGASAPTPMKTYAGSGVDTQRPSGRQRRGVCAYNGGFNHRAQPVFPLRRLMSPPVFASRGRVRVCG